jgi:hypothetical protein
MMTKMSILAIATLIACSPAGRKRGVNWDSSNPTGQLGNKCTVKFTVPEGMSLDEELTRKANSIAILVEKKDLSGLSISIDYKPVSDSITDFVQYRNAELAFLKRAAISPEVEEIDVPFYVKSNGHQIIMEKWSTPLTQPRGVYKKVLRFLTYEGFYSISINGQNETDLETPVFEEFLRNIELLCN